MLSSNVLKSDPTIISAQDRRQFQEQGYLILPRCLPQRHVELMRDELSRYLDAIHREMDAAGTDVIGINHRNKRYFIMNKYRESGGKLAEVLFSDCMAEVCRATIGPTAYLLNEQFTLKCARSESAFAWHQDSGYVAIPHPPWVTVWIALDDMSEANGTIYVLPFERAGGKKLVPHRRMEGSNDMAGYFGEDPGDPVIVPAGSVVAFSSLMFRRSGPNRTDAMRRAFTAEYGSQPLVDPEGKQAVAVNEPFLRDGKPGSGAV